MSVNNSVKRVLKILDAISNSPEGLTLTEISNLTNIKKSTCHDMLKSLYEEDAIYYKDPRYKVYAIGSKLYSIGTSYIRNSSIISAGEDILINYAKKYHKTIFITKYVGGSIIYVFKYEDKDNKILTKNDVGSVHTINSKSSLAQLYNFYYDLGFESEKGQTKTEFTYKISNSYIYDYMLNMSCPVFNFEKRMCGAILSVGSSQDIITKEELSEFINISKEISRRLGYISI